jgi:flagellar biosynthetic protein FliR
MLSIADTTWTSALVVGIARVGGIFLAAPVFSAVVVPARLRLLMAIVIGPAIAGRVAQPVTLPGSAAGLALTLAGEFAVGAIIGFAAQAIFAGVELGAFYVSQQMGLSLAEVFDPLKGETGDPVRALFNMTAVVAFLAIGGHRELISGLLDSVQTVPPMGMRLDAGATGLAAGVLASSFALALKVAAPALAAMLLATAAMGLLQRTMPQMNFLTTELPARALLGMVVLAAALAGLSPLISGAAGLALRQAAKLMSSGQG